MHKRRPYPEVKVANNEAPLLEVSTLAGSLPCPEFALVSLGLRCRQMPMKNRDSMCGLFDLHKCRC